MNKQEERPMDVDKINESEKHEKKSDIEENTYEKRRKVESENQKTPEKFEMKELRNGEDIIRRIFQFENGVTCVSEEDHIPPFTQKESDELYQMQQKMKKNTKEEEENLKEIEKIMEFIQNTDCSNLKSPPQETKTNDNSKFSTNNGKEKNDFGNVPIAPADNIPFKFYFGDSQF